MAKRCGFVFLKTSHAPAPAGWDEGTATSALCDEIARRAYEIYQCEGQPEGRQLEHWMQAQRELVSRG